MKVGDRGYFVPDESDHWAATSHYFEMQFEVVEIDDDMNMIKFKRAVDGTHTWLNMWSADECWVPVDQSTFDNTGGCQCHARLLLSVGHNPHCPEHNAYRKSKEPWRYS